jgi:predicted transcriptional regulator
MKHEEVVAKLMENPAVRAVIERFERDEMPMFDAILAARREVGLTQAQVAERMGTKAPAIARLENALITGSPSPSRATLSKETAALCKTLEIQLA